MKLAGGDMAGKDGSIKWQLCYDISARTWWMARVPPPSVTLWSPARGPGTVGAAAGARNRVRRFVARIEASRPLTPPSLRGEQGEGGPVHSGSFVVLVQTRRNIKASPRGLLHGTAH
ncbi:Nuclear factor 1 A-type [Oryzias melastigma]|uniref:Nuclear factor 1 A-type n=1 Tax=Oryzias melastigma TaxID=30732 RepID=A0A834BQ43_ORYME|nr:Nuclear factor 1 A-type [Oryzias melastigma]